MILYHATPSTDITLDIVDNGFRGNDVWNLRDVVFLAERPLRGFGGWSETWVAVEVPEERLAEGAYENAGDDWDNYHCGCYAFPTETVNQFSRRAILDISEIDA